MKVSLVRPNELGRDEIAAWRSMQRATPYLDNPFLSYEFALAVGRFRPCTQVAVLTEDQSIVGFFPFERRRCRLGVPVCGWLNSCQGVVHAPEVKWDPRVLLSGCGLSAWQFDNLIADQLPFSPYHYATEAGAVVDLTQGFDAYYSKLRANSPRFCRELARRARKLAREVGELRVVTDRRDANLLRALIAWKTEQYRQTSTVARFERAWLVGLLDALLNSRGDHLTGVISGLYAGDKLVAAQFGLRAGDLLVGWFTAYDRSFRKYSPGLIHIQRMIEKMAADGIRSIDMGGGAKNYYKEILKSYDTVLARGIVTDSSVAGTVHRVRSVSRIKASNAAHQHPSLHWIADQVLRRTGVARRIYGRLLSFIATILGSMQHASLMPYETGPS